jgi:hypothetical protein
MISGEQKVRSADVAVISIEYVVGSINCEYDLVNVPNYLIKDLLFSYSVREGLASNLYSRV